jgi:hypothetical protein
MPALVAGIHAFLAEVSAADFQAFLAAVRSVSRRGWLHTLGMAHSLTRSWREAFHAILAL